MEKVTGSQLFFPRGRGNSQMIKKRIYTELGLPTIQKRHGIRSIRISIDWNMRLAECIYSCKNAWQTACSWSLTANLHSLRKKIRLKLIWSNCKSGFENIYSVLALNIVLQLEAKSWRKSSGCQILSILSIMMHKCEHTHTLNTCV